MAHIEPTRAVVEAGETFDGRIIPNERAELDRPVRIREGATVMGSVYGATVEIEDGATVEGSVMASDAVDLAGHVHAEVGTPGKVTAEGGRVDGTVTGSRLRLTETVVRGNAVGDEAIFEECVVLGLASAVASLTLEETLCYTFRASGDVELTDATTVLPQAIVDGDLDLVTPVRVAGFGRVDGDEQSPTTGEHTEDDTDRSDDDADGTFPTMTEADLQTHDGTRYLTLAPRVLDLEQVEDRLAELEDGIMAAVQDAGTDGGAEMSVAEVLGTLEVETEVATS